MRSSTDVTRSPQATLTPVLWIALGLSTAAGLGAILIDQPLVAVGILALVPLAYLAFSWPDASTVIVIFMLYTNAAVVAVRFHGLPYFAGLLAPLPLVIPLAYYVLLHGRPIVLSRSVPWIVAFLAVEFTSVLFSRDPGEALGQTKASIIEGLALYLIVTNVVRSQSVLRRVTWTLVAAGALMGGLTFFQQVTGTHGKDYGGFAQTGEGAGFGIETARGRVRQARACGPIGEQNRYAQVMLMLVPIGLARVWNSRGITEKAIAASGTLLIALGCMLTFSRGAAIGAALVLGLMTAMRYIRPRQLIGIGLAGLVLMAAIPQFRARMASIPSAVGIFRSTGSEAEKPDGAIRGRATAMLSAARVCAEYPLLGVGPGMLGSYTLEYSRLGGLRALEEPREAHCLYLDIAAETGLTGLCCFLAIVFVSLRRLARIRRANLERNPQAANHATGFLLAVASYLATGLFLHFSYIRYFWLMLALADAPAHEASTPRNTTA